MIAKTKWRTQPLWVNYRVWYKCLQTSHSKTNSKMCGQTCFDSPLPFPRNYYSEKGLWDELWIAVISDFCFYIHFFIHACWHIHYTHCVIAILCGMEICHWSNCSSCVEGRSFFLKTAAELLFLQNVMDFKSLKESCQWDQAAYCPKACTYLFLFFLIN